MNSENEKPRSADDERPGIRVFGDGVLILAEGFEPGWPTLPAVAPAQVESSTLVTGLCAEIVRLRARVAELEKQVETLYRERAGDH